MRWPPVSVGVAKIFCDGTKLWQRVEWLIPSKKVAKPEVIRDDENIQRLHTNTDSSYTSHTCSNKGLVRIVFLLPLWVCTLSLTVPSGPLDRGMMPFHVAEMSWPKTAFKNSCSGLSYSQGDVMWWDVLPFDCALKKLTEVHSITLTQLNLSKKMILDVSRVIARKNFWKFCSCFLSKQVSKCNCRMQQHDNILYMIL